jgi:hypothetical protein
VFRKIWDAKFGQPIGLEISKFSIYHWQYRGAGDIFHCQKVLPLPSVGQISRVFGITITPLDRGKITPKFGFKWQIIYYWVKNT